MPDIEEFDAIVVGGGPAGATAAGLLAKRGVRVVVFERERFPREHVGESLLPASLPILEELGVLEAVEQAGFLKKYGATMVWGSSAEPWSWYFQETNKTYPHSYQVVRSQFDEILLRNAELLGADVREEHRVFAILTDAEGVTGVTVEDSNEERWEVRAPVVIDASGQQALIANALELREWDDFFRNLAVYGYFRGGKQLPAPDENNILVEAHGDGWCWTIPLHDGRLSVGVVVDADRAREQIEGGDLEEFLLQHIAQTSHTAALIEGATLDGEPRAVRDWSYSARSLIGEGYVLAGDSAAFIDPLFSSGVHLAMNAGVLAAAYVSTLLADDMLAIEARPIYERLYRQQYDHFRELAKLFYSSNRTADSYFWEARRFDPTSEGLPAREAFVNAVAGQPAAGYERVVLDRGEVPESFVAAVRDTEAERVARQETAEANRRTVAGAVPRIVEGVELVVEPVLEGGVFVRSHVVRSPSRPAGSPISTAVAAALGLADGSRSVLQIAERIAADYEIELSQIAPVVASAFEILYIEGVVEELSRP